MSSPAKLPGPEVRELLDDAIVSITEVVEALSDLSEDESWSIWNAGGAPFGKPQFKGPGHYTATEFLALSEHLKGRLEAVATSFEHRQLKEAERRERRAA